MVSNLSQAGEDTTLQTSHHNQGSGGTISLQLEAPIHLTTAAMTTDDMHRFSPAGVEVAGNQNIFQDIIENSESFFDSISMSDSTTANHFAKVVPHKADSNPTSATPTSPKAEETRDASPTITKKANDVSTHIIHDDECERHDVSPLISAKSIKMETLDNKNAEDCRCEERGGRLGALPRHENGDNKTEVQGPFQFDYSKISLFDTNSEEEIEGTGEEHLMVLNMLIYDDADLVKTDNGQQPVPVSRNLSLHADKIDPSWCTCSSKPFFQQEIDNELREPPTDAAVYKQRLEQIAAERSTIAKIAIKFEDLVMSICCGQEDEVLFVVGSNEDEHTVHSGIEEEETKSLEETPTNEEAKDTDVPTGLAGLLSTVRISTTKLSARDADIVPLYEKAVLDLVTLEHQIMRKSRSLEFGKKVLASCTHLDDKMTAATTLAFLEVEIKESRRKVVLGRESVKYLYEAFSLKTQKVIGHLQTEGFSLSTL